MAKYHQNKEIGGAVEFALSKGFRIVKAGRSSHAAFLLYCPEAIRGSHKMSVYSTPRNTQGHARDIRRWVDSCEHWIRPID